MLLGQLSPCHLECVEEGPRNLPLKFGQNRVSNSSDVVDIECLVVGGGSERVVVCPVIFMSNPTLGFVRLS